MFSINKNRTELSTPCWWLIAIVSFGVFELLSWIGWSAPLWGSVFACSVAIAWFIITQKNLQLGVMLLLIELVLDSFGYMLAFKFGATTLSLRMLLFIAAGGVMVWLAQRGQLTFWRAGGKLRWWYVALLLALVWGVGWAWFGGRQLNEFFLDVSRYLYVLLFPLWWEAFNESRVWVWCKRLLVPAMAWLTIKTSVTLYLFTHFSVTVLEPYYRWWRDTGFGEITYAGGNFFRVFAQSQVFACLGFILGCVWLWHVTQSSKSWRTWSPAILFVWVNAVVLLESLSRSFWLGAAVGLTLLVLFAAVLIRRWRQLARYLILLLLVVVSSFGFILALVSSNWPIPALSQNAAAAFTSRLGAGEAAGVSRLRLLPPLWRAVSGHPWRGSGFGAAVTFFSADPRIVKSTAGGSGLTTTYSFEWGYLDLWFKFGLIGLVGFLGFIVMGLAPTLNGWKERNVPLVALGLAGVCLLVIHTTTPYLNHPLGLGAIMTLIVLGHSEWFTRNPTLVI